MRNCLNEIRQRTIIATIITLLLSGALFADGAACSDTQVKNKDDADFSRSEEFTARVFPGHDATSKEKFKYATDSLWDDIGTLPSEIYNGMGRIYLQRDNFIALLLAGGASIAMHASGADDDIADNFEDHQILSDFSDKALDFIGGPGAHFAFTGVWYLASAYNGDELNKQRSWTMLKALSYTGFTTLSLKLIRDNDTPNGKWLGWPSGHTASSFCVASVLDEFYGPAVGIPSYLLAGVVAYRMMEVGDHWGSDVVFGAVLGYITGHSVAGEDIGKWEVAGFDVVPYQSQPDSYSTTMGVSLVKKF